MRFWLAVTVLAVAAMGGCTYTTNTAGGPGKLEVQIPASLATATLGPNGLTRNPSPLPPPSGGLPPSGRYAGTGRNLIDAGGMCATTIRVREFFVTGDRVRFGAFRGTVAPDGALKMQAGPWYIIGTFQRGHFTGRFWQPQPSCTYALMLDHIG